MHNLWHKNIGSFVHIITVSAKYRWSLSSIIDVNGSKETALIPTVDAAITKITSFTFRGIDSCKSYQAPNENHVANATGNCQIIAAVKCDHNPKPHRNQHTAVGDLYQATALTT